MESLLNGLNPEQRRAVTFGQGPLLIIAGAGTGKTKVITHRIAHLISAKMAKPEEILAVTFTEKAANEMEERVDLLIPYSYSFVEISTFNSFGERILRNYAHELGYPLDFRLLDDVEQAIFFREHLFRFPLKYYRPLSSPTRHIQELLSAIRRLKQEDVDPETYLRFARQAKQSAEDDAQAESARKHQELALVYKKYQRELRKKGLIDFEDQVRLTLELFRRRPSVRRLHQEKYKYILVDEFQDTNYIQFELLKMLAAGHGNITVVGDDDQSIFRFRGASLSNILNFRKIYPQSERVVINTNYRSSQSILDASYSLIQHNNPHRLEIQENIDKSLKAAEDSSEKSIFQMQFDTLSHEADRIAEIIKEKLSEGFRFRDFAILVRRNADADPFLRALSVKEIPFRFSGSRGLYSQKEVRILVAFIKSLTDFQDSRSLFYLTLSEVYAASAYDLTVLANQAHKKNLPLHRLFQRIHQNQNPAHQSAEFLDTGKRIFQDLLYFVEMAAHRSAGQVLYRFLEKTGYLKSLAEAGDLRAEMKIKNIRLFFEKIKNFSDYAEDDSIYAFAEHLELLQQVGDNPASAEAELDEDAVNVITVHKAKGLEFSIVFMVGLIADRYPGRARKEKITIPDDVLKEDFSTPAARGEEEAVQATIHEERRLFYVGMTRAKRLLYLTWARDYGLKRLKKPSPFVLEALELSRIPDETLRTSAWEELKRYSAYQESPAEAVQVQEQGPLKLSFLQVDDYLTCPLKFKYRHLIKVPVLPHFNLVYGRVLHDTLHTYLQARMEGKRFSEKDLLDAFAARWLNEGYLSREHEEMKRRSGENALRRFFQREEASGLRPHALERQFRWQAEDIRFTGRWDRLDVTPAGTVLIDFKAAQIKNQEEADKRTKKSLQMDIYALSFQRTTGETLAETQLHFLESDIIGHAIKSDKEIGRAWDKIKEAKSGIQQRDFSARPDWHNCHYCEYNAICPSSYAY